MSSEVGRKRKQDCWTDFIYSTPSSPSNDFNFENFLEQQTSGSNSRRHSVAVGELDYHSIGGLLKQDAGWEDLQLLLSTDLVDMDRPIHKRTMSLREDNPMFATFLSSNHNNNTNLFSPSFLDALVAENDAATMISDMSFMDSASSTTTTTTTTDDLLKLASTSPLDCTITPATITSEINTMADWLLEQQQQQQGKKQRCSLSPSTQTLGSSMSPSPPITPMQSGFEEDYTSLLLNKSGSPPPSLQPLIQDYLLKRDPSTSSYPGERTVMVLTSKVAQKSYGTEKRFLCPPPTTILKGTNWWTNSCASLDSHPSLFQSPNLSPPKLTIHISGETINQTGVLEWQTPNGTIIDPTTTTTAAAAMTTSTSLSGRCVSKQLYINDADEKRKRVEVLAKIQLSNGLQLGTFPSKGIKVISKPSKKRQSVKNMELCIHHGTTISLFNRIRSQTVSTKYLGVSTNGPDKQSSGTCFVARTGSWDPFVVWIVDTTHTPDTIPRTQLPHHPTNPEFPPPPAIALQSTSPLAVHYNQPVVLQCVTTGLVSPVMIIRKVDKGSMVLGGMRVEDDVPVGGECGDETLGDPVSQLHKVAFQIVQDPSFSQHQKKQQQQQQPLVDSMFKMPQSCHPVTYLACLNDVVGMHKTNYSRHLTTPACTKGTASSMVWHEEDKKGRRRNSQDRVAERRGSSDGLEGACWTEDVSDAAVWTIVGTDCASYTYWIPSPNEQNVTTAITPFPVIHMTKKTDMFHLSISGENLSRDLSVWFGDVKSIQTEYKSRDSILCKIPDMQTLSNSPTRVDRKIPLLLVRGDGVVYKTNQFYAL